ncbi:hypothetical protein [Rhodococcus koreensis]|uniref:hypothetical protein n=1 Tax=Rhodococcus koreensis TaxID=99653 RepID=UPI00197F1577|nr:hypothetical protein [Rhodococcus koreensis]QSE81431.1 hypothetical protein JWS14_20895 [Rhodococcus koreensis]
MTGKPVWRKPYDAADRAVAPLAEALVRSGQFATAAAAIFDLRRTVGHGVNGVASRVWHLVNLPAGTDVHRLRTQIGALDRDVRRLSLQLEQRRGHPHGE